MSGEPEDFRKMDSEKPLSWIRNKTIRNLICVDCAGGPCHLKTAYPSTECNGKPIQCPFDETGIKSGVWMEMKEDDSCGDCSECGYKSMVKTEN
jgi:hypothetical protein